jgi:hypothetical protein
VEVEGLGRGVRSNVIWHGTIGQENIIFGRGERGYGFFIKIWGHEIKFVSSVKKIVIRE